MVHRPALRRTPPPVILITHLDHYPILELSYFISCFTTHRWYISCTIFLYAFLCSSFFPCVSWISQILDQPFSPNHGEPLDRVAHRQGTPSHIPPSLLDSENRERSQVHQENRKSAPHEIESAWNDGSCRQSVSGIDSRFQAHRSS